MASLDVEKAVRLLTLAADQGQPDALAMMAQLHAAGHGLPKDPVRAMMYYELAQAFGSPTAKADRAKVAATAGSKAESEARRLARQWREMRGW